jgi:hypothetical protein
MVEAHETRGGDNCSLLLVFERSSGRVTTRGTYGRVTERQPSDTTSAYEPSGFVCLVRRRLTSCEPVSLAHFAGRSKLA